MREGINSKKFPFLELKCPTFGTKKKRKEKKRKEKKKKKMFGNKDKTKLRVACENGDVGVVLEILEAKPTLLNASLKKDLVCFGGRGGRKGKEGRERKKKKGKRVKRKEKKGKKSEKKGEKKV